MNNIQNNKKICRSRINPYFRHINRQRLRLGWVVLIIILCFSISLNAQSVSRVGTTAAPFLKIGVGGRALAMGEAYATRAEDVTGLFWNPAGLANLYKRQILINHFDYIADLSYVFGGIAIPFPALGTFGFSFSFLGMPEIERTTIQFPEGNGEKVAANSFAAGLSFARSLTDRFSIGGSIKYIKENIWHCHSSAVAFDIGVLYHTIFKNLTIGMSISNFGTDLKMDGRDLLIQHDISEQVAGNNQNINANLETDKYPLPVLFRVGISSNLAKDFFEMEKYDFILAIDAVHPNDNKEYLNLGSEIKLYDLIALRAGYRQLLLEKREGGLTFGFGLNMNIMNYEVALDYANVDFGRLDRSNKFSLIFSF